MSECGNGELRDLLPDLVADRLGGADRARVAAHVATCAACAAEVELLRAARWVASRGVPTIDVARIVAALPRPVSGAADSKPTLVALAPRVAGRAHRAPSAGVDPVVRPVTSRRTYGDWRGWRIAAAATIAVGTLSLAVLRIHGRTPDGVGVTTPVTLPGLAVAPAMPPGTSAAVPLGSVGGAAGGRVVAAGGTPQGDGGSAGEAGPGLPVAGDISELSDGDVETLLQDMSGLDAEPEVDPDAAAPAMPSEVSP